ncbi:unnamed protein product [Owenia fusiformis]|uniref:Uncharacterized protein n=1 Tax=Owenia fusiformis TaxID=6347 RepID=A0A8J1XUG8_OWEFU|nr:unnamed protein product [Owenia fusiformis]
MGFKYFQDKIPNGNKIPHPCKPNYVWQGVGHKNSMGGGERNAFGLAFAANGKVWDAKLCNADSDNDGKTNGVELGDPNCEWTEGEAPESTKDISHPGVCEPWDSAECLAHNQWEFCDSELFSCPAMDATDDVRNVSVRFPPTQVPALETNYYCITVELPEDGDYHLIATTPIINNTYVMHHMLLFGCKEGDLTGENDARKRFAKPTLCGMDTVCRNIISTWTLGLAGECFDKRAAFRIGKNGYKYAVMRFWIQGISQGIFHVSKPTVHNWCISYMHWNNPELRSDYTDSSGLTLFYTPNKRQYDAGYFLVGQRYLKIEGGLEIHTATARASSKCTRHLMPDPIYILGALLHMHYLGKAGYLDHYRDGNKVGTFGRDDVFSYDSPVNHMHEPPKEFLPGDEIFISCTFDSRSRKETTYYGDDTSAEMCYGFFQYYPVNDNLTAIVQYKNVDICAPASDKKVIQGCNVRGFIFSPSGLTDFSTNVLSKCSVTGDTCKPECKELVKEARLNDRCMGNNEVYATIKGLLRENQDVQRVWKGFESCDNELEKEKKTSSASILSTSISLFSCATCFIILIT